MTVVLKPTRDCLLSTMLKICLHPAGRSLQNYDYALVRDLLQLLAEMVDEMNVNPNDQDPSSSEATEMET